jgi:PDGLE domain
MQRISLHVFAVLGLTLAVVLAVFASPFASASPDGLEKVAGENGFLGAGRLAPIQEDSPIPDYAFPGIADERVATAVAGLVGTLLVAGLAYGVVLLARRRRAAASA